MVSIVTKTIKGKEYIYLVDSLRKGKKVVQKTIKYIGKKRPIPQEEFECMKLSYKNRDWVLQEFSDQLSYKDHEELRKASNTYKEYFEKLDTVSKEKAREKFLSIFIANSNAIEGSTLTAKETFDFLFKDTVPKNHRKKELFMAQNLLDGWNYVQKNSSKFPTKDDLLILHKKVNRNIETEETLGEYKKVQNYIGDIHTTSYLFTEEKMNQLLEWIKKAFRRVNDFEVAFQSHAQFEIIHPFVDGNGRVGRLLLNWILMIKGYQPLAMRNKRRNSYIQSLENSRRGKIEAICKFCYEEYLNHYKFL